MGLLEAIIASKSESLEDEAIARFVVAQERQAEALMRSAEATEKMAAIQEKSVADSAKALASLTETQAGMMEDIRRDVGGSSFPPVRKNPYSL